MFPRISCRRCGWILQDLMWAMVRSTTRRIRLTLLFVSLAASPGSPLGGFLCGVIIPLPTYPFSPIHPEGSIPSSSPEGARGGHVVHGPRIGAPGPTRTLHRAGPGIRVVHPRAPVLDRPQIAVTAPVPAGEIECRRPPRWSQSRGISSAVSRRTAGVRQIAAVIALMARGSNGPARAQPLADHRPHNAIMAHVHHSRPQRPGQTQDRRTPLDTLLSQPGEQLVELVVSQTRGAFHNDDPLLPGSWLLFLRHP